MAVARSSHNFCSLRGKVTSLFSRGYNVNLLATFVSDRSGAQIVVGTVTRLLHAGQKDNERKRKGECWRKQDKTEEQKQMGCACSRRAKVAAKVALCNRQGDRAMSVCFRRYRKKIQGY